MKRIIDEFVFVFGKPIADIKSFESQLMEQNARNFVFKIKEKDKEEATPVNRYPVFSRFSDIVKSKLIEIELFEKALCDQMFKQFNSLLRFLLVDTSFSPLLDLSREKKSTKVVKTITEWKHVQQLCSRSLTLVIDSPDELPCSYLMVDKALVIDIEERGNDFLFYIFFIEIVNPSHLHLQYNDDGTCTITNLMSIAPQMIAAISSFMQQVRNRNEISHERKEQIEKEWVSTSLTFVSKNGRTFFKSKNISTLITPADDDFTKYTPRPPPPLIEAISKHQQQPPSQITPNDRFVRNYKIREQQQ